MASCTRSFRTASIPIRNFSRVFEHSRCAESTRSASRASVAASDSEASCRVAADAVADTELDVLAGHVQSLQHSFDDLKQTFEMSDAELKAATEFVESKVQDELAIMATSVEVKTQDAMNTIKLLLDDLEMRMRDEVSRAIQETELRCEKTRQDTFATVEENDRGVRQLVIRHGDEQVARNTEMRDALTAHATQTSRSLDAFEQQLRDESAEQSARTHEVRRALFASIESFDGNLRAELADFGREIDMKNRDLAHQLSRSSDTLDAKLLEEVARLGRDGDLKDERLQQNVLRGSEQHAKHLSGNHQAKMEDDLVAATGAQESLETRWREEFRLLGDIHDAKHRDHASKLKSTTEDLEEKIMEELARVSKEQDAKHDRAHAAHQTNVENLAAQLRDELGHVGRNAEGRHRELLRMSKSGVDSLETQLRDDLQIHTQEHAQKLEKSRVAFKRVLEEQERVLRDVLLAFSSRWENDHRDMKNYVLKLERALQDNMKRLIEGEEEKHQETRGMFAVAYAELESRMEVDLEHVFLEHDARVDDHRRASSDAIEPISSKLREEFGELGQRCGSDVVSLHGMLASAHETVRQSMGDALAQLAAEHESTLRERKNAQPRTIDDLEHNLRDELAIATRVDETTSRQMRVEPQSVLQTLETKLQDDRQGGNHEVRHKDLQNQIQVTKETLETQFGERVTRHARDEDGNQQHPVVLEKSMEALERGFANEHHEKNRGDAAKHRSMVDEVEGKSREELPASLQGQDEKHSKAREAHLALFEASDTKLREQVASVFAVTVAKHQEMRGLLPHAVEALEPQWRRQIQDMSNTLMNVSEHQGSAIQKIAQAGLELRKELDVLVRENHLSRSGHPAEHDARLDEMDRRLRDEAARCANDRKSRDQHLGQLEALEQKVHQALGTSSTGTELGTKLKQGLESVDGKLMREMRELKDQREQHHHYHCELLRLFREQVDQVKKELANQASAHEDKFNEPCARHKASVDDAVAKLNQELGKVAQDDEATQRKILASLDCAVEAAERKFMDGICELRNVCDDRHKELRDLLPSSLETLESKLRDEHSDAMKNMLDLHERHKITLERTAEANGTLRKEMRQTAKEHEAKHREVVAKMRSGQEASEAKLWREMDRMTKEHHEEHARTRDHVKYVVECVDERFQEEIARVAEDTCNEGKRQITNLHARFHSVEASMTCSLQQNSDEHDRKRDRVHVVLQRATEDLTKRFNDDVARLVAKTERVHEEHSKTHRAATEALHRKLTDMLEALAAEHHGKHQETRDTLQQSNAELIGMLQREVGQVVEANERTHLVMTESSQKELEKIREEIARSAVEVGVRFEQGWSRTAAMVETLQQKLEEETETRHQEVSAERDMRIKELTDVCGAVKSVQALISDVESTATQRFEARERELGAVDMRLSELRQFQAQLRADIFKQQEQVDHLKGFQADQVTDELRSTVRDLVTIADGQGTKINDFEKTLNTAREAKHEVHRLKSDLEAESSMRTMKDTELQGRLDREVKEFSRRVERLTTATSELGSDLRKSRSISMHTSTRVGSLSASSLGSASDEHRRSKSSSWGSPYRNLARYRNERGPFCPRT